MSLAGQQMVQLAHRSRARPADQGCQRQQRYGRVPGQPSSPQGLCRSRSLTARPPSACPADRRLPWWLGLTTADPDRHVADLIPRRARAGPGKTGTPTPHVLCLPRPRPSYVIHCKPVRQVRQAALSHVRSSANSRPGWTRGDRMQAHIKKELMFTKVKTDASAGPARTSAARPAKVQPRRSPAVCAIAGLMLLALPVGVRLRELLRPVATVYATPMPARGDW